MPGRSPDFILKGLDKRSGARTDRIGAAWQNADGTVQMTLDPGTVIEANVNLVLTLFPNDRKQSKTPEVTGITRFPIDTRKVVR